MNTPTTQPIPVTILTGFLGAGKTTLLNHILTTQHNTKFAVIINEFGQAGIDDKLITAKLDEEVFEMNNGCICCTVRGDLIRIVNILLKKREKFDHILVETTGLADPAPVAQTFFVDADVRTHTRLDSILTVVDAAHIVQQLQSSPEAQDQIAFADTILINKIDAVTDEGQKAKQAVQAINPYATVLTGVRGHIPLHNLLNRGSFDLNRMLHLDPAFTSQAQAGHTHQHTQGVTSLSLTAGALRADAFENWMSNLLQTQGPNLLRIKGILAFHHEPQRFVFQAVHMMSEGQPGAAWDTQTPTSTLVIIGRNLNTSQLRADFLSLQA